MNNQVWFLVPYRGEVSSKYWVTKSPGAHMESWPKSTGLSAGRGQINTKKCPRKVLIQNWFTFQTMFWHDERPKHSQIAVLCIIIRLAGILNEFVLLPQPIAAEQSPIGHPDIWNVGHPDIWNSGRLIKAGHNCPLAIVAIFWVIFTQADVSVVIYEGWEGEGAYLCSRGRKRDIFQQKKGNLCFLYPPKAN